MAAPNTARDAKSSRQAKIDWIIEHFTEYGFSSYPTRKDFLRMDSYAKREHRKKDKRAMDAMIAEGLISPKTTVQSVNMVGLVEEAIKGTCLGTT